MKSPLRSLVHHARVAVYRAGFDVTRETFRSGLVAGLDRVGVDTVLDVGANTGQFATDLRAAGYGGRIVSIEPLSAAFDELSATAASDAAWTVERAAVSGEVGTVIMHVSANSVSSSVLPMADVHADAAPESRYVGVQEVVATTVDALCERHAIVPETALLKIDVQGYEQAVLDGAAGTLGRFAAVRTEMSLVALYEGQELLPAILDRLGSAGFELWYLDRGLVQPDTRRLLQADGTFFRAADPSPGA